MVHGVRRDFFDDGVFFRVALQIDEGEGADVRRRI
jgi:hypothetical protein